MSETMVPDAAVVVVAAGSGTRLGRAEPKAFVSVMGRPLLAYALDAVFGMDRPVQVVVVAPPGFLAEARAIGEDVAGSASGHLRVVVGGATRQSSVAAGLAALDPAIEVVLVHDAARALAPSGLHDAVVAAVRESGVGAVPGLAVVDTIKRVNAAGGILGTVDRSELSAVQTPQGFPRDLLEAAYAASSKEFTDDAALVASAGGTVRIVPGDPLAFKVTTSWDLRRAEQLLAPEARASAPGGLRVGTGVDVHAFAADIETPLWLAGLHWPGQPGLAGHSDGDVVSHAICDALLSAAGLGDIGGIFGTDDPRLVDAHGEVFLRETLRLIEAAGYRVGNVSVQLVGNRPELAPRRAEAEVLLGGILGAPVSVSATTTDSLGFTGRGEGIAAIATALLVLVL
ncbi:2-C-methyl-D-erythritol 4-phosphate cytidylyltransferase [Luethyella okanaganae]|uniref:Bifunctional enzyme IspD/IspF n=1 Tax=Luethyella okanaganae TaxID=69372 RepID=A0ABW1VK64_9MICO